MIPVRYDTTEVSQSEQFSYWNDLVCNVYTQLECERSQRNNTYQGKLTSWDLDQMLVSIVNCDSCDVFHSKSQVSKSNEDVFLMHLQLSGQSVNNQNGHDEILRPGDFALCSSSSPYSLSFNEPIKMMVVKIPKAILQKHIANPDIITGIKIDRSHGSSSMLIDYMQNLWKQKESITDTSHQIAVSNIALSLLSTTYDLTLPNLINTQQTSVKQGHIQRIKMDISKQLNNPNLSPGDIAKANNMSTRYLRMLFAEQGTTFGHYIMSKRLEAIARTLEDKKNIHIKTTEVAYRWGFNNSSHFSKSFKEHFGITPTQYRESISQKNAAKK